MYIIVTYFSVSVKLYLDDASSKSIEGCYNDLSVTMVYSIRRPVKLYKRIFGLSWIVPSTGAYKLSLRVTNSILTLISGENER